MNSAEWLKSRSTSELLDLQALMKSVAVPSDWVAERPYSRHYGNICAELWTRRQRQINFMERLDGKDAPDDT